MGTGIHMIIHYNCIRQFLVALAYAGPNDQSNFSHIMISTAGALLSIPMSFMLVEYKPAINKEAYVCGIYCVTIPTSWFYTCIYVYITVNMFGSLVYAWLSQLAHSAIFKWLYTLMKGS